MKIYIATGESFEKMIASRIKCVDILMSEGEWHVASYLMGHILECTLKATICKVLKVKEYPADMKHRDNKVPEFFRTHFFDRLALLAGVSEIFSLNGNTQALDNWSQFTAKLPGDWVSMRYYDTKDEIDEQTAKSLYGNLLSNENAIIKTVKETWI